MSRPNPGRTIGAEIALKGVVDAWLDREDRTGAWLARKMTEAGCPISSASLWKLLNTGRAVYVDEALAISAVTGIPLAELVA